MIAEKMITDRSRDYMNARRVAKEFEVVARGLNRNAPSIPPQNTAEEAKQKELWRKYIDWEKSNPLRTEDMILVIKRGSIDHFFDKILIVFSILLQLSLPMNNVCYVLAIILIFGMNSHCI